MVEETFGGAGLQQHGSASVKPFVSRSLEDEGLGDATKRNLVVDFLDGEGLQKIVARAAATPEPLIAKIRKLIKDK